MKFVKVILALIVALSLLFVINPVIASGNSKISSLEQQISDNNKKKKELDKKKKEVRAEQNEISKEIGLLDIEIEETNIEISDLQIKIKKLENNIEANEQAIVKLSEEIDANNILLEKRLRASYKHGVTGYIELVVESKTVSQAISRIDMIKLILKDDVDLLKSIETQKNNVTALKLQQEDEKKEIETVEKTVKGKLNDLYVSQQKKEKYMSELRADIAKMEANEKKLEAENAKFEKQIQQLQLEMQYVGGELGWPLPLSCTRITSNFGGRTHPIYGYYSFHRGVDIACSYNTTVKAANDGVVIVAGYHYSYGYYIIIDHGGKLATVYGHNTSLLVKVGDRVTKGQTISLSGSTGESTGPHLHFEVRKNGVVTNPMPYLSNAKK